MNILPFPGRRSTTAPDVSAVAFVHANLLAELQEMHPVPGETLADYHARRDAALDVVDDLLEEFAEGLDEVELLGGAA